MPIDLTSDKARQQYHDSVLLTMAKLEGTVARLLKPVINSQYMLSAKMVEQGINNVDFIIDSYSVRLRQIMRNHYQRVINVAGRNASKAFDKKSMGASFWQEVNQFTGLYTGKKVTQVQATTKKAIARKIKLGIESGQTGSEIATELRKLGRIDSNFRALRIARTETLGVYNAATEASVRDTGLKFDRVWSTTLDMRTRRRKKGSIYDHAAVNGQRRKQGEPFDVSGEFLDFPGDPKGSAGNIINCRCVLLYERPKEPLAQKPTVTTPVPVMVDDYADLFASSSVSDFEGAGAISEDQLQLYNRYFGIPPKKLISSYGDVPGFKPEGMVFSRLKEVDLQGVKSPEGSIRLSMRGVDVKDDSKIFYLSREVKFIPDEKLGRSRIEVENINFAMSDDLQGKGIGKKVWQNAHRLHKALTVDSVKLSAGLTNGGYAWSKYGFLPLKHDISNLKNRVRILLDEHAAVIDDATKNSIGKLLNIDTPDFVWRIADITKTVDVWQGKQISKHNQIGKLLLRGSGWEGYLDYSNPAAISRLEKYIGIKQ